MEITSFFLDGIRIGAELGVRAFLLAFGINLCIKFIKFI